MIEQTERIWYKAKLLPAAASIFTDGFYPEAKRGTGNQYVWMTQIDPTPSHSKVLIASRMAENSFRMVTLQMAQACLEPKEKATRIEMAELNRLSLHLKDRV